MSNLFLLVTFKWSLKKESYDHLKLEVVVGDIFSKMAATAKGTA
jgi:hypothetical protein